MYRKVVKRILDIIFSLLLVVILSPVYLVTAILVRCKLGSPVLYKQLRPGKNGKIFSVYKFRSMSNATGPDGKLLSDEERLTPFGRKLRATSLDELPQLLNILKGDMSFIGPRPLRVRYLPWYTEEEMHRHDVRPGLTGLAQISGRNAIGWEDRFHYDLEYVHNLSFGLDCKILKETVGKVLHHSGVQSGNEQTLEDFDVQRKKAGMKPFTDRIPEKYKNCP